MTGRVLVIGGGMAGMTVAGDLASMGIEATLVERADRLGGHVADYHALYPTQKDARDLIREKEEAMGRSGRVKVMTGTSVSSLSGAGGSFTARLESGQGSGGAEESFAAVVLATGFDIYGVERLPDYNGVLSDRIITGLDFERHTSMSGDPLAALGGDIKDVAIVLCSGSRDQKHNPYCCEVGCKIGLNQALYIRERYGEDVNVYLCFIDIRAHGKGGEAFYRLARERGVRIIRGRPSDITVDAKGSVSFIVLDQITKKLLEIKADLVVLETTLTAGPDFGQLSEMTGAALDGDGFFETPDYFEPVKSTAEGVFVAGACAGPRDLPNTMGHASRTALAVADYLRSR